MDHKSQALEALHTAERRLRQIAQDALAVGDYAVVAEITQWAKALADLQPAKSKGEGRKQERSAAAVITPMNSTTSPGNDSAEFPRFERQAKRLVKLGWSERDRRIYEHRAPYGAVEEICKRFIERAGHRKLLKADKLLPMKGADGEEIPSYQVYLVLKWLQQRGVVEKQGKDGYVIADPEFDLRAIWDTTPAK